jgi:hypothetical protein
MARGQQSSIGDTRVSPNRYHYTRTEDRGWQLTHRLIMEKHLGRKLAENERVVFKDKTIDRTKIENITVENLVLQTMRGKTTERRRAQLEARIAELQAQLAELDDQDP